MFVATLHCSDPGCDAEVELEIEDLRELDGWPCGCGYGLALLSVGELITSSTESAQPMRRASATEARGRRMAVRRGSRGEAGRRV
jgi:hypothetical protein